MKSTALLWRTEWINKHMKIHIFHILVCALKVLFCSSLWACPSLPLCWDLTEGRDHEVFPCLHPQSLACCLIQEVLNKQCSINNETARGQGSPAEGIAHRRHDDGKGGAKNPALAELFILWLFLFCFVWLMYSHEKIQGLTFLPETLLSTSVSIGTLLTQMFITQQWFWHTAQAAFA